MPVPSSIADLSTSPASNSPAGSETPSSTDDYLRTHAAFIKQTYDAAQSGTTTWCGTAGGTANALTLTPSPAITAYAAGQVFRFKATATNTAATTIAISGLTTVAAQVNGAACAGGEIVSGQWYEAWLSDTSTAQVRACAAPNQVGAINFKRATVAATATTTPLWATANGNIQDWTGTPTITDFPAAPQAGSQREVYPAAGTIITNAGNISVQGNANYTVAAGDKLTITAITATTFYVEASPKVAASASQTVKGIVQLATTVEVTALADLLKAITPGTLPFAFTSTQSATGVLVVPSTDAGASKPIIFRWGVVPAATVGINTFITSTISFATPFPNNCFVVLPVSVLAGSQCVVGVDGSPTVNSFQLVRRNLATGGSNSIGAFYLAIGN